MPAPMEPANFDLYHTRRDLIAKRNAAAEPLRTQLNTLIEYCDELNKPDLEPGRRAMIEKNLADHLALMDGTKRTDPFPT